MESQSLWQVDVPLFGMLAAESDLHYDVAITRTTPAHPSRWG